MTVRLDLAVWAVIATIGGEWRGATGRGGITAAQPIKMGGRSDGLAVLVLLYLMTAVASGQWNPWKLVEGADGWDSTSKLQWLLWIVVILFSYTALCAAC